MLIKSVHLLQSQCSCYKGSPYQNGDFLVLLLGHDTALLQNGKVRTHAHVYRVVFARIILTDIIRKIFIMHLLTSIYSMFARLTFKMCFLSALHSTRQFWINLHQEACLTAQGFSPPGCTKQRAIVCRGSSHPTFTKKHASQHHCTSPSSSARQYVLGRHHSSSLPSSHRQHTLADPFKRTSLESSPSHNSSRVENYLITSTPHNYPPNQVPMLDIHCACYK